MKFTRLFSTLTIFSIVLFYACKTTEPEPIVVTGCASKTIVVTATSTPASKCSTNGKLAIGVLGSTGFSFQLNSGSFQSDSNFNNLAAGNYNITVKDKDGCTKTATFTISESGTKGTTFTSVAAIIASKCQGGFCHGTGSGGAPVNIMDTDCKIVALATTIQFKTNTEGMGSLSTTEKNKITTWINAGGKYTD